MSQQDYKNLRRDYHGDQHAMEQLLADPSDQFQLWMDAALAAGIEDATACSLATTAENGQATARIVLLKEVTEQGFSWYTSYDSRKGHELAIHPKACLLFYWGRLSRQVRIEGAVERLSQQAADAYFHSRPRESQISAAASHQSAPIDTRQQLEQKADDVRSAHGDSDIPKPESWGGYVLVPQLIEFWQGRENRLHDRVEYRLLDGVWVKRRLQP